MSDEPKRPKAKKLFELESGFDSAKTQFGPWAFDQSNLTLTHKIGYEIDVETWTTSAKVLDWIFQIHGKDRKSWADENTVIGLLDAMDHIVYPQGYLCSCGAERGPIKVREVFAAICKRREK